MIQSGVFRRAVGRRWWRRNWVVLAPGHGVTRFWTRWGAQHWFKRRTR
jgi:hypothetical protein